MPSTETDHAVCHARVPVDHWRMVRIDAATFDVTIATIMQRLIERYLSMDEAERQALVA